MVMPLQPLGKFSHLHGKYFSYEVTIFCFRFFFSNHSRHARAGCHYQY